MKRLTCMALACLLLFGCAPVAAPEATDPPVLATQPSAAPAPEGVGLALPAPLDPLGFFADPDVYALSVEEIAAKYDAVYETVPDLYEIPDFSIGGYDARLYITTKNGMVEQVYMPFVLPESRGEVYKSVLDALGEPDRYEGYDDLYGTREIGQEEFLQTSYQTGAQWKRGGYTYEFGEPVLGNSERPTYFAVYREKLNLYGLSYYWRASDCCPHEDGGAYFDPTGIFMDDTLFTADAQNVLSRYGARPTRIFDGERRFKGDPDCFDGYMINGTGIGGCPAPLHLYQSERVWHAAYRIDVTGQSADTVFSLFNEALSGVKNLAGSTLVYVDGERPVSFFDENAPVDEEAPYAALRGTFSFTRENGVYEVNVYYSRHPDSVNALFTPYEHVFSAEHSITCSVSFWAGEGD